MPPRQRGKSPAGRGRKATKELREKADEMGVAYHDDVTMRWQRRSAWMKFPITAAALITLAYGFRQWWCDRDCRAEKAILTPHLLLAENMPVYVPRPFFEAQLAPHVAHASQEYIVVIGPRGVGKSRVVDAVVADRPGVLLVDVGESQSVVDAIFSSLGENLVSDFPERSTNVLKDLFRRVALRHRRKHPAEPDWVPTLVVEVRSGKDGRAMVHNVAPVIKSLNTDKRSCRVILVLSDADAAFGLPTDDDRQMLVWVDDFTSDEANQFFDNVGCLPLRQRFDANNTDLNDRLRRRWFEFVGTRPAALEFVANQLARVPVASLDDRVDELIDAQLEAATNLLRALFEQSASPNGAQFRQLVELLLQAPDHAVGRAQLTGDVALPDVATNVLKRYHALIYHIPSSSYRFYSPAFLHAARRLLNG
jgi:energy-coupling factor transporter ATP-binding protein EcfA2